MDMGDIGGAGANTPYAINNNGVIVGSLLDASNVDVRSFIWRNGVVEYLEPLVQGFDTRANDINDSDEVTGYSYIALGVQHAVLWRADGTVVDLGTLSGEDSIGHSINDVGEVAGQSDLPDSGYHAFLWIDGQFTDLGDLGRQGSSTSAINNSHQVVGGSFRDEGPAKRAFVWESSEMVDLGTLPNGSQSEAEDINDGGVIAGYAIHSSSLRHAVLWEDRVIRSIHNPSIGGQSEAYAINESGQVVGFLDVDRRFEHTSGFLYEGSGPMVNVMTLLPPGHTWRQLLNVADINDHGEIVAYGDHIGGSDYLYHAVLLTPIRPTLTLQGPQPGTAGTLNGIRATGCTPGSRVHFFYSTTGGGTLVPGCNHTDGVTLQLENPIRAGTATANANGIATLTRFIPRNAANLGEVLIQAVDADNCQISQLVVHEFE
ncbi:MAG: DUF3466 family protein [Phycisphaerales bacterium]|nr:DUF3466 family protein [Phycisphaerales bacterium]